MKYVAGRKNLTRKATEFIQLSEINKNLLEIV